MNRVGITRRRWARGGIMMGLAGAVVLFFLLQTGGRMGVSPDSVQYLYAAGSRVEGQGIMALGVEGRDVPLTHFPPLLPLVLSAGAGAGMVAWARVLNGVLLVGNLLVFMRLVSRGTQSPGAGLVAGAVAGSSWMFLNVHAWVWSEPLFLLWMLLCALCLAEHLARPRLAVLALAGVLAGLATLTRYVGLSLLPVGLLVCLMAAGRSWPRRWMSGALFLALAGAGPAAWFVRNRLATGALTNRSLALHPVEWGRFFGLVRTLAAGLPLPGQAGMALLPPLAAILVVGWRLQFGKQGQAEGGFGERCPVATVLSLMGLSYVMLLFVSIATFDASTPLDERMLAPAGMLLLGVFGICLAAVWRMARVAPYRKAIGLLLVAVVVGGAVKSHTKIAGMSLYWADESWGKSAALAAINRLPKEREIYSNAPDGIWYLTGRRTMRLPLKFNPYSEAPEAGYGQALEDLCRRVEAGAATVVYLDEVTRRFLPTRQELESRLQGKEKSYTDGAVFGDSAANRH